MAQIPWLNKMHSKSFFRKEKADKGFLKYSFQKSSSNISILFLGIIKNPSKNFSTKF